MSIFGNKETAPVTSVPNTCPLSDLCHQLVPGQPFPCGRGTAEQIAAVNLASQLAANPCSSDCVVTHFKKELQRQRVGLGEAAHLRKTLTH